MGHFCDLPNELLLPIWDHLRKPLTLKYRPQTAPFCQLCLVSKALRCIAQPILYSIFWSDAYRETWRIRAFLRTIICNPFLAAHVTCLSLHTWRAWDKESDEWENSSRLRCAGWWKIEDRDLYDDHRRYSPAENRKDRKFFQKAIRDLALVEKAVWRLAVRKDVDEVFVALLLLLLPNLKELAISTPGNAVFLAKAIDHATVIRPANSTIPSLQNLEELSYDVRGNSSKWDINVLAPFLRLPNIRTVSAGERMTSIQPWPQMPLNRSLRCLDLRYSGVSPESLSGLFKDVENLESFSYSWCPTALFNEENFERRVLDLSKFGSALFNVASSLKELYLKSHHGGDPISTLGSLRGLSNLRCLSCPERFLSESSDTKDLMEMLPASLEEFNGQKLAWNKTFSVLCSF